MEATTNYSDNDPSENSGEGVPIKKIDFDRLEATIELIESNAKEISDYFRN